MQKPRLARLRKGHPLNRGLVAAWSFDEGAGSTVFDLVNRAPGAISSGPSWTEATDGPGLNIDGGQNSGWFVNLGTQALKRFNPANPWALGLKASFANLATSQTMWGLCISSAITGASSSAAFLGIGAQESGGSEFLKVFSNGHSSGNSAIAMTAGRLNSIILNYDGTTCTVYNNGKFEYSVTPSSGWNNGLLYVVLGAPFTDNNSYPWRGAVSDARVWNDKRTIKEILAYANTDYSEFRPRKSISVLLPLLGGSGAGEADASLSSTLGNATVDATGEVVISAALSNTLAAATASGAAGDLVQGSLAVTLDAATVAATANGGAADAALDKTLGAATATATGAAPVAASVGITLGAATLTASARENLITPSVNRTFYVMDFQDRVYGVTDIQNRKYTVADIQDRKYTVVDIQNRTYQVPA